MFDTCYKARVEFGGWAHYERIALPATAGGADQPAKLMAMLDWIEQVSNDELRADMKRAEDRRGERSGTGNSNQRQESHVK